MDWNTSSCSAGYMYIHTKIYNSKHLFRAVQQTSHYLKLGVVINLYLPDTHHNNEIGGTENILQTVYSACNSNPECKLLNVYMKSTGVGWVENKN